MNIRRRFGLALITALALGWISTPLSAITEPEPGSQVGRLAFEHSDLYVRVVHPRTDRLAPAVQGGRHAELARLGGSAEVAYYDLRSDRWGTLLLSEPMIPGSGVGNSLTWSEFGLHSPGDAEIGAAALSAFRSYLERHATDLRINPEELSDSPWVTVHEAGRLVQINIARQIDGVPVRGALVRGVINSGNLIIYGVDHWADPAGGANLSPSIAGATAIAAVDTYVAVGGRRAFGEPKLELVPFSGATDPLNLTAGAGYDLRLVWSVEAGFEKDHGTWEALVDAHSGELLAFRDLNQYATTRQIRGGILPVSNDGQSPGGVPDGVEQPGYPMPFADVLADSADQHVTNSAGLLTDVHGHIRTDLSGPFVAMNDNCGDADELTLAGDLDLEFGPTPESTDCDVPPGHTPGDTKSSRTGFYEVGRIQEQARGWLPGNGWLGNQLTSNMNINNSCNAFWGGGSINFYRKEVTTEEPFCANTGEIAAVFDHEWGHGMDDNDANPSISSPGEAAADIYAILRLNTPCIGRGFRGGAGSDCSGHGDACLGCTGVRHENWMERLYGLPHDVAWILQDFTDPGDPGVRPGGGCEGDGRSGGPCNNGVHCEGSVVGEAFWDFLHRDLQGFDGSAFNLDDNTVLNLGARIGYFGGGNVGSWFSCVTDGEGGCGSGSGYMQYLAADDDNGDITDGTPHMTALFSAFDRHGMACSTPAALDSGCASGPSTAPVVTGAAFDNGVTLDWGAVPGAAEYWVFRTEGVHGCNFGKVRIAQTADLTYTDTDIGNGLDQFYTVVAVADAGSGGGSCQSPASSCLTVSFNPPDATDDLDSTTFETPKTIQVLANDTSVDPPISVTAVTDPANGSTTIQGGSSVNYTPDPGFLGSDTFDYTACSAGGDCTSATADVTVHCPADGLTSTLEDVETGAPGWTFDPQLDANIGGSTWAADTDPFAHSGATSFTSPANGLAEKDDRLVSPPQDIGSSTHLIFWHRFNFEAGRDGGVLEVSFDGLDWVDAVDAGATFVAGAYNDTISPRNTIPIPARDAWSGASSSGTSMDQVEVDVSSLAGFGVLFRWRLIQDDQSTLDSSPGQGWWIDDVQFVDLPTYPGSCPSPPVGCVATTPLFSDDFEVGDTSAWDLTRNPQGDLSIDGGGALEGALGMTVHIDHSSSRNQRQHYVATTHAAVPNYCWSFLFDPNSIQMPDGKLIRIWGARSDDGFRLLDMAVRAVGGSYSLAVQVRKDGGSHAGTSFVPMGDAPVLIGGEWSNTPEGGVLRLFIDGALAAEVTGITNVSRLLSTPGMGNLGQLRRGTLGDLRFDLFTSGWTP